jgi:diguanylate cyclase (GGDEF)-like protein
MRRYDNVRLRNGIGWINAAGDELELPLDGDAFQVAEGAGGRGGFLLYVVELPAPVAILSRPGQSWIADDGAAHRLLAEGFGIVIVLEQDGPGAAVANCHSPRSEPLEDAACALWALKAKGGRDEAPIMTFMITHDSFTVSMIVRSTDAFQADVSRALVKWDAVRAELAGATDLTTTRVILGDVDWMLTFNDAYTPGEGDLLLVRLWSCLEERARREGTTVVRVGGDEFAVVVSESVPGAALRLAEALRQDVEALNIPFHHPQLPTLGRVTVSAGIVTPDDLSRLPDEAADVVYEAKRAGRNRVAVRG